MRKILYGTLLLIILSSVITGCGKSVETERDAEFHKDLGDKYLVDKNYKAAITSYENALMRAETPEIAAAIQLNLANSYFFSKKYSDSIPVYETYLDVYSDSKEADLAFVRLGLSYYELQGRVGRDISQAEAALGYFNTIKTRSPQLATEYEIDEKIHAIKEIMAKKEMIVAKYYVRIFKPEPAILRYKYLLEHYPDSKIFPEASFRLIKLLAENDPDEASNYLTLLMMKYPDNRYTARAARILNK